MTEIHAQMAEKATRYRKAAIQEHNDKTYVRSPNFQVGDYVLVAEHRKSGVSKLQVKWKGPRRVASVDFDYVFVVENLLTKEVKAAHATRLRFHNDKDLNVTAELAQAAVTAKLARAAEHNYHKLFVVSKILDARYNEQEMPHELLVAWRGFAVGEVTWEPYSVMALDFPDMMAKFMESHEDIDAVREMRSL
jgi:Chromo (CHRromatin Organisation MOdifier) domain